MRRLLLVLCAGALIAPAAAAAKSENGVFTIEVSGTSSGAWSGPPGNCAGSNQASLSGQITETATMHTRRPVAVIIQGLRSTLIPYDVYRLPDWEEGTLPVEATITRSGSLSRTICDWDGERTVPVEGAEACFGTRTFDGDAIVGFTNVDLGVGNSGPYIDSSVFGCSLEDSSWEPGALLPGPWDALGGRAPIKRSQFTQAKPGKPIVLHMHDTAPCKVEAPQSCTEAAADWTVTVRFVCRAKRDSQSCLTKKARRRLGI
jgi:hypothetical protein